MVACGLKTVLVREKEFGVSLLAGPASGNVPPRTERTTEFPANADAAKTA